ncbi:MAG: hypothetical protein R6W75_09960 [Smithellaceae bacterium]
MKTYHVWYRKEPTHRVDKSLTIGDISKKYCMVSQIHAGCLSEVFEQQQSEIWSARVEEEMAVVIKKAGLHHTSMDVGDVAEVNGKYFQVDLSGWIRVES